MRIHGQLNVTYSCTEDRRGFTLHFKELTEKVAETPPALFTEMRRQSRHKSQRGDSLVCRIYMGNL